VGDEQAINIAAGFSLRNHLVVQSLASVKRYVWWAPATIHPFLSGSSELTWLICMADTRLTKINLWRKVYLCILAVLLPKKFVNEEEVDNEERKKFSQPPPPGNPNIFIIRRAFWLSLFLVVISGCIGYVLGYTCNLFIGCVDIIKINILQIIGALFLLWGTLFVRGWEIQTYGGVTLTERVNRWLYRSMYCTGTAIIIFSIELSQCLK
jgi:hypothetical protein